MNTPEYYALQVRARREAAFIERFKAAGRGADAEFFLPLRVLLERRRGKIFKRNAAVFPGYVFALFASSEDAVGRLAALREAEDFFRFLPSNKTPRPLSERDLKTVRHFLANENAPKLSRVSFDENNRIVVLEGALKGLEGNIIAVDRRKRRAKVRLDLCENAFTIDLSFEVIESAK